MDLNLDNGTAYIRRSDDKGYSRIFLSWDSSGGPAILQLVDLPTGMAHPTAQAVEGVEMSRGDPGRLWEQNLAAGILREIVGLHPELPKSRRQVSAWRTFLDSRVSRRDHGRCQTSALDGSSPVVRPLSSKSGAVSWRQDSMTMASRAVP